MSRVSRRGLLAGFAGTFGAASFGGATLAQSQRSVGEYMFERGLNYLNTAALGPTPRFVLDATLKAWRDLEANPVMMAYGDGAVHKETDAAREQLGGLIGCTSDELMITRSATAAMNAVAFSVDLGRGDRVLTTDVEHEGGSIGWEYLKKYKSIEIDLVSIAVTDHDSKAILQRFEKAITPQTRVISVSHVVTSTGLRMPVAEIAALARSRGIISVIDGAQAVGCIDVNVRQLGCDAYIATGHKWVMGPKGTGFAYINKNSASTIHPVERELGTRFVVDSTGVGALPLVVGLGVAAEAMKKRGMSAVERRTIELRNRAYAGLMSIPRIKVVSAPPGPLATALVAFKLPDSVESRAFRDLLLKKYKIVVKAAEKRWFNGNRISPHIFNTEVEIDAAVEAIRRELS